MLSVGICRFRVSSSSGLMGFAETSMALSFSSLEYMFRSSVQCCSETRGIGVWTLFTRNVGGSDGLPPCPGTHSLTDTLAHSAGESAAREAWRCAAQNG